MEKAWKIVRTAFWIFISIVAFPAICYIAGDKLGDWCLEKITDIWSDPEDIVETILETADEVLDDE